MSVPYTYLIGWSKLDLWYYGCQYSKTANPSNLWTTYFTSSSYVNEARKTYGEPDVVEVRKTFESRDAARGWEHRVLKRMKVRKSKRWLNKSDIIHHYTDTPKVPWNKGKSLPEDHKEKIRDSLSGRTIPSEVRQKMKESQRLRDPASRETREKLSLAHSGKTVSNETKEKMRLAKLGVKKETVMCQYCNKNIAPNMYKRWHGKNCKNFI
jgi:hypothetical protein